MALLSPDACPVDRILCILRIKKAAHARNTAVSTPGHLVHYIDKGGYTLVANNRRYPLKQGDLFYYYESEQVEWQGGPQAVTFYSVGFMAKKLLPLPVEKRHCRATAHIGECFKTIYRLHHKSESIEKSLKLYSLLMELLAFLYKGTPGSKGEEAAVHDWWELESLLREKRLFRPALADLTRLGRRSYSTLYRMTAQLFNRAPLGRVQDIRLEEAKGLLRYSALSVTEIADYLGYPGINAFSREFSGYCRTSPTRFRQGFTGPAPGA